MKLENNYYELISIHSNGLNSVSHIALRPDCNIYHGHFPHDPICPGVFNIQTIKECAERLVNKKLRISCIRQCRLTAVATPATCPEMDVTVSLQSTEAGYNITATIVDATHTYMDYKGEMTV